MTAAALPDPPRPALPAGALRSTALRAGLVLGAAVALGAVRLHRPPTICLLRATTGIPCPICGTTTAAVRVGRGDLLGALAANPVTLLAVAALVLAPVLGPLLAGRVHLPQRARPWLFTCAAAFAWMWQLARFDRLPFQ